MDMILAARMELPGFEVQPCDTHTKLPARRCNGLRTSVAEQGFAAPFDPNQWPCRMC